MIFKSLLTITLVLSLAILYINAVPYYVIILDKDMTKWENEFAFLLYRNLSVVIPPTRSKNLAFSPYAIYISLIALYEGAHKDTKTDLYNIVRLRTQSELRRNQTMYVINKLFHDTNNINNNANGISSISSLTSSPMLRLVNAFYVRKAVPIHDDYANLVRMYYHASTRNVNFASYPGEIQTKINDWVKDRSNGMISSIVPDNLLTARSVSLVVNTMAFTAPWQYPFLPRETAEVSFSVSWKDSVNVPMVKIVQTSFNYLEDDLVQIIELPYHGHHQSMMLILPKGRDIAAINRRLDEGALSRWLRLMKMQLLEVVLIPRFKVTGEYHNYEIDYALKKMGLSEVFNDEIADLSGIAGGQHSSDRLYVDDILHKVQLSFDEYGTNYAHVGKMNDSLYTMRDEQRDNYYYFTAMHPFIFLIRDLRFGKVLFMGSILDPRKLS